MSLVESYRIESFGVVIDLQGPTVVGQALTDYLPDVALSDATRSHVSYEVRERTHGRATLGFEVWRPDGTLVTRAPDPHVVARNLANDLHFQIASRSVDFVFVHAGVVAWNGRAIVLPGRSMSGKTSLVTALLERDATYYSDEYAVFDPSGLVHPYARPLRVRAQDGATKTVPVSDLTSRVGSTAIPVGLIAVLRFEADAAIDVAPIGSGAAALALIDNTVRVRDAPGPSIRAAAASSHAVSIEGSRGEAGEAAEMLLEQSRTHFAGP